MFTQVVPILESRIWEVFGWFVFLVVKDFVLVLGLDPVLCSNSKMLQVYKVSLAFADTFTNFLLTGWYMWASPTFLRHEDHFKSAGCGCVCVMIRQLRGADSLEGDSLYATLRPLSLWLPPSLSCDPFRSSFLSPFFVFWPLLCCWRPRLKHTIIVNYMLEALLSPSLSGCASVSSFMPFFTQNDE